MLIFFEDTVTNRNRDYITIVRLIIPVHQVVGVSDNKFRLVGIGKTIHVPDQPSLTRVIHDISDDPQTFVLLAHYEGTEPENGVPEGEVFEIISSLSSVVIKSLPENKVSQDAEIEIGKKNIKKIFCKLIPSNWKFRGFIPFQHHSKGDEDE